MHNALCHAEAKAQALLRSAAQVTCLIMHYSSTTHQTKADAKLIPFAARRAAQSEMMQALLRSAAQVTHPIEMVHSKQLTRPGLLPLRSACCTQSGINNLVNGRLCSSKHA
jgi:hypothetical protein